MDLSKLEHRLQRVRGKRPPERHVLLHRSRDRTPCRRRADEPHVARYAIPDRILLSEQISFARAFQVLDEPRYLEAARRAAAFIQAELWEASTQTLRRHYKDGAANVPGFAEDYAFLIRGLLDLHEAGFEIENLQWAEELDASLTRLFWDEQGGGYFSSSPDPRVLLRFKEDYDGAEPSPNSVAAENNARLSQLLEDESSRERAAQTCAAFSARLNDAAPAMPFLLQAKMRLDAPPLHVVIVGEKNDDGTKELLSALHENFLPHKTVILLDDSTREYFASRLPFVREMKQLDGKATVYVCRDFACQKPTNAAEELRAQLKS